jgi:hypothetical protein
VSATAGSDTAEISDRARGGGEGGEVDLAIQRAHEMRIVLQPVKQTLAQAGALFRIGARNRKHQQARGRSFANLIE